MEMHEQRAWVHEGSRCSSLCIATVSTVVAEPYRLPMCSPGYHLINLLVESRSGVKERYVGLAGESTVQKFLSKKLEKRGVMWLLQWQPPSNHFHAKAIVNSLLQ